MRKLVDFRKFLYFITSFRKREPEPPLLAFTKHDAPLFEVWRYFCVLEVIDNQNKFNKGHLSRFISRFREKFRVSSMILEGFRFAQWKMNKSSV